MNPSSYRPAATHRKNHTWDRLETWAREIDLPVFSFFNLLHDPGEVKRTDVDTAAVEKMTEGYDVVLALGGFVSDVLTRMSIEHFKLPHPSPRNRLLNSKEYERDVLERCKSYVSERKR